MGKRGKKRNMGGVPIFVLKTELVGIWLHNGIQWKRRIQLFLQEYLWSGEGVNSIPKFWKFF
jgi:hypothetical protein